MELSQSLEDCLEAIYIQNKDGSARVRDIAKNLNIKAPSVNQSITKLKQNGYVSHKKYGKINLTKKGKKEAMKVYKRHKTLETFLKNILDIKEKRASKEACIMEHGLSSQTQKKLSNFIENFGGDFNAQR